MGLRCLYDAEFAEGHPVEVFLISLVYTVLGVGVSQLISKSYASLMMVFMSNIALVPLYYKVMSLEAKNTDNTSKELSLLHRHTNAIKFLIALFLGMTAGYLLWYLAYPDATSLFTTQIETINTINVVTGNFHSTVGNAAALYLTNLGLFLLTLILSIVFGVGTLMIFSWNASVIAVAIGAFILGLGGVSAGNVTFGLLRYLLHGVLEMSAYFFAALAGSIISIELIKQEKKPNIKKIKHVLFDVGALGMIGIGFLLIAAIVEAQIIYWF